MALVRRRIQTRLLLLGLLLFCFSFLSYNLNKAYAHGNTDPWVHQRIAKKALDVWIDCPFEIKNEIKNHASNDVNVDLDPLSWAKYNPENGDDIITGSGEEDQAWNHVWPPLTLDNLPPSDNENRDGWMEHFWNPDVPNIDEYWGSSSFRGDNYTDGYNKGLVFAGNPYDSTYRLAQDLWDNKVIRLYREGKGENNQDKIKEAYYWLGRVAHLLTDMTVPAHVHLLGHADILPYFSKPEWEDYFETYFDKDHPEYITKYCDDPNIKPEYRFESLPNLSDFDWSRVHSTPSNLFRLFWYTAQKTQYYASRSKNDLAKADGNLSYQTINGDPEDFSVSLWHGENVTIIIDQENVPTNLEKMADALIPHAMKAVAGLYRLFWIETHAVKWSFGAVGESYSSPAIGPDGIIYVGGRGKLYALYPNGTKKWELQIGDGEDYFGDPAIGPDGTIYVQYGPYTLYAIDPQGPKEKWPYFVNNIGYSRAIGRDGTVYVNGGGSIIAIPPSGPAQGVKTYEHNYPYSNPVIGPDGTVYAGSQYGLFVVHPNGTTETWSYEGNSFYSSPIFDKDGTLYVKTAENLLALNPNGTKKWAHEVSGSINHLVIGGDGRIYWVEDDWSNSSHPLYAIGRNKENKQLICHIASGWGFQAIGADDTIYVYRGFAPALPEYDNFYAIDPNGAIKWMVSFSKNMSGASPPVISPGGDIYVRSASGPLLAIDSSVGGLFNNCGGPAKSPWPMYGANPQQTFRANVNRSPMPFLHLLLGN